jgi:hypothetical protein
VEPALLVVEDEDEEEQPAAAKAAAATIAATVARRMLHTPKNIILNRLHRKPAALTIHKAGMVGN